MECCHDSDSDLDRMLKVDTVLGINELGQFIPHRLPIVSEITIETRQSCGQGAALGC